MTGELKVCVDKQYVGLLSSDKVEHFFTYLPTSQSSQFISLTMPVRHPSYDYPGLHPIFEMSLPEGYLLAVIQRHFAKIADTDELGLLKLLSPYIKGRLGYTEGQIEDSNALSLEDILHPASDQLFNELVSRFALRSPVSGVQPKVLASIMDKATLNTEQYIVKAWGDDYPELALNEFICMTIVKMAKISVPEFYLSDDQKLFVMKRFDITSNGHYLGFEDGCVLQGKPAKKKYTGSYEQLHKTLNTFVSPKHRNYCNEQFFKMLVLNNVLQNGDAHLKNYGVIYADQNEVTIAPAYDVVSTTYYIKHDVPALTLMGSKRWWAKDKLIEFGQGYCSFSKKQAVQLYRDCEEACRACIPLIDEYMSNAKNNQQKELLVHLRHLVDL